MSAKGTGKLAKHPVRATFIFGRFPSKTRRVHPASRSAKPDPAPPRLAISILAGGLSTRMGRDKTTLRLRGKTLLGHVRTVAKATDWPVRVIRRDLVTRCGPLGGVYTALKTSRADAELFLACDMPFVSLNLLREISTKLSSSRHAVFAVVDGTAGFPFVIRKEGLPIVEAQMARGEFSLQKLALALKARRVRVPKSRQREVQNFNTPEEFREALRSVNI